MADKFSAAVPAKRILVIGAGTFGRRAVHILNAADPSLKTTIVDQNAPALAKFKNRSVRTVCRDGIVYLAEQLGGERPPDWIIPAIPEHMAYKWLRMELDPLYSIEPVSVPAPVFEMLPNPIRGQNGEVYTSNAGFICPDDCPEPKTVCSCTGKPRPMILHSYLAGIIFQNFRSVTAVSRQLAPGVGGYTPKALFETRGLVKASHTPVLLSTACKCHGVMNAFKIGSRK
jgi:hypothetical protein